jgi:DNA-binding NtrC family response regulator
MHVLIVDDHPGIREALRFLFELSDLDVAVAASPDDALAIARRGDTGVVVQDMNFSMSATTGEEGAQLFRDLRAVDPGLPVILMTAWTDLEMAVSLVREGADDYVAKPWDDAKLLGKVQSLLAARASERSRPDDVDLAGLVYASPEMHAVVRLALRVASSTLPVVITGPTGAGKERVAALIRANGPRRDAPFVIVNCGALPDDLLEAELFGAEAGAFTGAGALRRGRFETAHGGTLFLDEVGTLSLSGQAALLRVLQSGEYSRLGSSETRRTDVRVVSATNVDLRALVADGAFREDLYYRLAAVEIAVPPLVDRPADIDVLSEHFLVEAGAGGGVIDPDARRALHAHGWPGNVRELQTTLRRALLVGDGPRITAADLGLRSVVGSTSDALDPEAAAVLAALREADGVVSRAASILGLSRQALYRRMDRLGIRVDRKVGS